MGYSRTNLSCTRPELIASGSTFNQNTNSELLEVKDSERDLNTAKLEVLKEKYNYITGLLDLEYALNATLEEIKEISNE